MQACRDSLKREFQKSFTIVSKKLQKSFKRALETSLDEGREDYDQKMVMLT